MLIFHGQNGRVMEDEPDEDEEETPRWQQLAIDVFATSGLYGWCSDWYSQAGWRHWVAYPLAFVLAWLLFDRARDLWRWVRDRRNAPTIQPGISVSEKAYPPVADAARSITTESRISDGSNG